MITFPGKNNLLLESVLTAAFKFNVSRELAILLRTNLSAAGRKQRRSQARGLYLPTLLKAVIRLHQGTEVLPELKDALDALLMQLDVSWLDPDGPAATTEILEVVHVFVKGICDFGDSSVEAKEPPKVIVRGKLTALVKDMMASDKAEKEFLEDISNEEEEPADAAEEIPEEEEEKVIPDKVVFFRKTILHTRHFISMVSDCC